MTHLNITFPEELKSRLDEEAKRQRTKRSTLIQKAVRIYLELKKQKETQNLLRESYQAMYGEAKKVSSEFEELDRDAWKFVD